MSDDVTPRPMQVRADAMRARALGFDVEDVGPTPPDPPTYTLTLDPIPDPSTSPVNVTGTVAPGAVVNVGIMQDGNPLVATNLDASEGAFSAPYELPVGTGYAAHVHVTAFSDQSKDGNTFSVTAP